MEPRQLSSRTRPIGNAASKQRDLRYTAHFGLHEQPFNITADPRFFYPTPGHEEAYATLLYGIHERKGCITLIGEAGTGKTTLLHRVREHLEPTVHTAFFSNITLTFEELLDFICQAFDLPVKEGRRLKKLQELHEFLLAQLQKGGTGVLIIDEAQNLSNEILENLRLLSNFEAASEKLLQIILVGQPELEKKIEQPELRQLKQRIALRARLEYLKAREVAPFIHHRLHIAGCTRQDVFPPEALQRIAMYSGGIPRLINTLCDNALMTAYGAGQQNISASMIEEVARKFRLQRIVGWQPEVGSEMNANGITSQGMVPMLPDGHVPASQIFMAGSGRSWSKRLTWSGVLLLLLALLCVGDLSLAPQQNRERATPLSMSSSPPPTEQNMDEPQEQQRASSPQDTASLSPTRQQRESLTEESSRAVSPSQPMKLHATEQQGQSVTITRGDTIAKLVLKMYGAEHILALDLLKEYNPHLADLNRVAPGEQLWLPFLTLDTLVRPQADGSYHLILGAFPSLREAERRARRARRRGYVATITPRQISGTWWVQRVEVEQLPDLAAVDRARSVMAKSKG